MKLKAKVVAVESESLYSDGLQRIKIRFEGAEPMYSQIIIRNEGFNIDDDLIGTLNVDILAEAEAKIDHGETSLDGKYGHDVTGRYIPTLPTRIDP